MPEILGIEERKIHTNKQRFKAEMDLLVRVAYPFLNYILSEVE